jgi:integrase
VQHRHHAQSSPDVIAGHVFRQVVRKLWTLMATQPDEAFLFPKVNRHKLYYVVRDAGERAGVPFPVGLHTFRHSAASIMFRRGVP